jgi:hypothetical protein
MTKITDDELQRLNLLKQDALEVASTLGELTYQKVSLELEIEKQKKIVERIKNTETQIFEELRSKYGNVSVNIETGELN